MPRTYAETDTHYRETEIQNLLHGLAGLYILRKKTD